MLTYVAGAPGHVDDENRESQQKENDAEHEDQSGTQGEVNLQRHVDDIRLRFFYMLPTIIYDYNWEAHVRLLHFITLVIK